jgi:hypothetical protein
VSGVSIIGGGASSLSPAGSRSSSATLEACSTGADGFVRSGSTSQATAATPHKSTIVAPVSNVRRAIPRVDAVRARRFMSGSPAPD